MTKAVVAIFGIVLFAVIGIFMFQGALSVAGDTTTIENETFTPTFGQWNTLDDSNVGGAYYHNKTTVLNDSNVALEAGPGEDYRWAESNGSIKPLSGGDWNSSDANITYKYDLATNEMQSLTAILAEFQKHLGLILIGFMGLLLLIFIQ